MLHDLNLAAAYATKIALMSHGALAAFGPPEEVLRDTLLSEVFECRVRVITDPAHGCPLVLPDRTASAWAGQRTAEGGPRLTSR